MFWIHLAVVLICIFIGARLGGLGLGVIGGLGVAILVFVFQLQPASPPIDVILIILAVITAAASLQTAGGLDYLVSVAEKALRKHPNRITFFAPMVTYLFTLGAGTGHVAYSVMPVIAEVAREAGVRPERPMSVAAIASQQAITVSPVSAATAAIITILTKDGYSSISLGTVLAICLPATFLGCMIAAFVMNFVGKELKDDEIYQEKLARGEIEPIATGPIVREIKPGAKLSVGIFISGAIGVVILGLIRGKTFAFLNPVKELLFDRVVNGKVVTIGMPETIEITMLVVAALIVLLCKVNVDEIVKGTVFRAGAIAVIAIFGVAWMGDTFFQTHKSIIQDNLGATIQSMPWIFAFALFLLSILLYSQAATVRALMPLAVMLGINPYFCLAMFPAVNGYFFIPNYPTIVAAINFDRTGTTRIGKYVLNHSFMLPGLIATTSAVAIGFGIAYLIM